MSNDYVPPGLGRTLEDLINKHTANAKAETPLQWAKRNAAKNKAALAKMAAEPGKPGKPARPDQRKAAVVAPRHVERHRNGKGRTAYEWAVANGASAVQAAAHFGIDPNLVYVHRRQFGLAPLADGRIRDGSYVRMRRRKEEVRAACAAAYVEFKTGDATLNAAALKHGVTFQSLIRFCVRNKLPRVLKAKGGRA